MTKSLNLKDKISYFNEYEEKVEASIEDISSDMDSYDLVKLENGVPLYYSKKLNKWVPIKEKNIDSVFLTVKNTLGKIDYIMIADAI